MRVNSHHGNQTELAPFPRRSVYDSAADRIGDIQEQDQRFLARDRQGRALGTFASQSEAADAIEREAKS
jgi:hypothetical protein